MIDGDNDNHEVWTYRWPVGQSDLADMAAGTFIMLAVTFLLVWTFCWLTVFPTLGVLWLLGAL